MGMLLSRCAGNYVRKQSIIWFYILFFILNFRGKWVGYWQWHVGKLPLRTRRLLAHNLVWWSFPWGLGIYLHSRWAGANITKSPEQSIQLWLGWRRGTLHLSSCWHGRDKLGSPPAGVGSRGVWLWVPLSCAAAGCGVVPQHRRSCCWNCIMDRVVEAKAGFARRSWSFPWVLEKRAQLLWNCDFGLGVRPGGGGFPLPCFLLPVCWLPCLRFSRL